MFLDQDKEEKSEITSGFGQPASTSSNSVKDALYYAAVVIVVLAVAFAVFYFFAFKSGDKQSGTSKTTEKTANTNAQATSTANKLPGEYDVNSLNGFGTSQTANIKAEDITFRPFLFSYNC